MENVLARTLAHLEPLAPVVRVGHLRRRRVAPARRTHDLVVGINRDTTMTADGASHLRRSHARRARRDRRPLPRRGHREHPRPRAATRRRTSSCPPGELDARDRARPAWCARSATSRSGVAAHPEPHPRSPPDRADRQHTAEKLAEADFAITQFFFDAQHYFDLVESLRALGVDKPVIAGIMPATSAQLDRAHGEPCRARSSRAGCADKLEAVGDDPDAVRAVGHRGGHEALPHAPRRRRAGSALLHAEPLLGDAGDLPGARPHPGALRPGAIV